MPPFLPVVVICFSVPPELFSPTIQCAWQARCWNIASEAPETDSLHEDSVFSVGVLHFFARMPDAKFFEITLRHTCRAEHAIGSRRDRVKLELLLRRVQKIDGARHVLSRILDFLDFDRPCRSVIDLPMCRVEFLACGFQGIRSVTECPQQGSQVQKSCPRPMFQFLIFLLRFERRRASGMDDCCFAVQRFYDYAREKLIWLEFSRFRIAPV